MATTMRNDDSASCASVDSRPVIDVRELTFTYPKTQDQAVRGMSFTVGTGEIFGFLGPSGAGKSTTQKILTGLLQGDGGNVAVWGRSPRDWGDEYYERIGVSFELPNHYLKLTALENLEFFASLYRGETADPHQLLDMVGLGDKAHTRVSRFSKGMQMRLVFVRALLNQPKLLFLDEPTSGLDPGNARLVKDIILNLKSQGCSVFLTTHDMATAEELCDRVAFVVDGTIGTTGPPAELRVARSRRAVRVDYREDGQQELTSAEFGMDGLADDTAFRDLVRTRKIEALHSQEADLNDVFIEVTGEALT